MDTNQKDLKHKRETGKEVKCETSGDLQQLKPWDFVAEMEV